MLRVEASEEEVRIYYSMQHILLDKLRIKLDDSPLIRQAFEACRRADTPEAIVKILADGILIIENSNERLLKDLVDSRLKEAPGHMFKQIQGEIDGR